MAKPNIYAVIPPSPLFAAHWSFFVPDPSPPSENGRVPTRESRVGRRVHVTGDRLNGFELEIIRSYDVSKHRSVGADRKIRIGRLVLPGDSNGDADVTLTESESFTTPSKDYKDDEDGGGFVDNNPKDCFERLCLEIDAPGPSLNKVGASSSDAPTQTVKRKKPEVRDCQWWIAEVMRTMIDRGMLVKVDGDEREPVEWITALPKH
jgi:hypothetical protein